MRSLLKSDQLLGPLIISTFLQGSYRRATAIKPHQGKRADVDVVVVTKISETDCTPEVAQGAFVPFLEEYYGGNWEYQGRSIGVDTDDVELDLVITSAPSQAEEGVLKSASVTSDESLEEAGDWRLSKSWLPIEERSGLYRSFSVNSEPEWKTEPLMIPDRDAQCWEATHPLAQIQWTTEKNKVTNGHYVNVVKALKWWRRVKHLNQKYPKGYPVEHIIGLCCPNGITSIEEGVVLTLENIVTQYGYYAERGQKPVLCDHGVPTHDVLHRLSAEDFVAFYRQVEDAAKVARCAFDATHRHIATQEWRKLFGEEFPEAPSSDDGNRGTGGNSGDGGSKGGFTRREEPSKPPAARYA